MPQFAFIFLVLCIQTSYGDIL